MGGKLLLKRTEVSNLIKVSERLFEWRWVWEGGLWNKVSTLCFGTAGSVWTTNLTFTAANCRHRNDLCLNVLNRDGHYGSWHSVYFPVSFNVCPCPGYSGTVCPPFPPPPSLHYCWLCWPEMLTVLCFTTKKFPTVLIQLSTTVFHPVTAVVSLF